MRQERAEVWRRLGAPDEQVGSVNEPRETVENGAVWNEKWIYRGGTPRVVLWNRYDLVGIFRVGDDGSWAAESLADA